MLTLKATEGKFEIVEVMTEAGEIIKIGDVFEVASGSRADDGRDLVIGTKVKIEKFVVSISHECIVIESTLPDGSLFSGTISSFKLGSREYVVGIHNDNGCGGNIIAKGSCRQCDKCKEYLCGCSCG